MLFNVHVIVLRAVRESLRHTDPAALEDRIDRWHDAIMYWFGINAESASDAVSQAERAAEHARDRDGQYIGGVVSQVQTRRAHIDEFANHDDFLLQPISQPGIFYVTGTTSFTTPRDPGAFGALEALRNTIREHGLPPVSFAHPKPPDAKPPGRSRILCPNCHRWAEVDNLGIVYSRCDGLDPDSVEAKRGQAAGRTLGEFMQRHTRCLNYSRSIAFTFLHEGDGRFDLLDASMEDDGQEL
jgi:hypothetical protein